MKCLLLDVERFVKLNGWDQVSDPINFEKDMVPSVNGLFSTSIFGTSTDDRRNRYAYIDLKGKKFLSPKAYISLKFLDRKFESVIYGTKRFRIETGRLVEDENGETGIDWLYKNWENFKFEKSDSYNQNEKIDMLSLSKKNTIFLTKFIVIPAFYRDVNMQQASSGSPRVPEINDMYNNIIRNITLITAANNLESMTNALIGKTQQLMVDVYNHLKQKVEKKTGYLRRFVMGKSVDYCARIVITAANYDSDSWKDQPVDFEHTGVPLSFCLSMLTPFIIWWVTGYFKTLFENTKNSFPLVLKNGEKVYVKLDSPELVYNNEYIEKALSRFIDQPSSRFDKIEVPIKKEYKEKYGINYPVYARLSGRSSHTTTMAKGEDLIERPLTWTDIFYMAAIDSSENKHVEVTRFPMLDYLGTLFTDIHVMSTRNTMPVIINDRVYPHYPVVDLTAKLTDIESLFIDSFKLCPLYLDRIGGDHDGDQVTGKMLFTIEANDDAYNIMRAKRNLIAINGDPIYKIGNEGIQTFYTLTRFH